MKIKDFVVEKLSAWGLEYSEALLLAEISRVGLNGDAEYDSNASQGIDLIFYNIIPDLMMRPSNITEGGFSISYDKKSLTNFYNQLCRKLGKPSLLVSNDNSITDITKQW